MGSVQHAETPTPTQTNRPIEKVQVLQGAKNLTVELVPGASVTIIGVEDPNKATPAPQQDLATVSDL